MLFRSSFRKSGEYISYYRRHSGSHSVVPLHRELFYITPDHNKDVINHLNQIGIDNTYQNLDVVSSAANNIYKLSRGYITSRRGLKQVRRQIESIIQYVRKYGGKMRLVQMHIMPIMSGLKRF